ncbi:putative Pentatricopeptide repeat-containing protein, mitochondrial [Cocos nucifera]|uniref:apyrase n=1 Tax=Cocos nucifera TaxID=13894 RepID=A0A8K0N030_COCNU|nr:putative Pentatricopeptide repeat-containing protein, mitochondrial [Cocos nucifera]
MQMIRKRQPIHSFLFWRKLKVKPGLSSYADDPQEAANSLVPLLEEAESMVPEELQPTTPIRLGATAGLRILGEEKSEEILKAVRDLFQTNSSFEYKSEWVTVLEGYQEGSYLWVAMNYLLGNLGNKYSDTVGVVDLGGGSVQMAYALSEEAAANAPNISTGDNPYVIKQLLNETYYYLYVYSYLHYGLFAARAEILEAVDDPYSYCMLGGYTGSYEYSGEVYNASASPSGPSYSKCRTEAIKALKINETCTYQDCTFGGVWSGGGGDGQKNLYVASSFYYTAAEVGIIDSGEPKALVTPSEFEEAAKTACKLSLEEANVTYPNIEEDDLPYICMDLVYEYTLLVDGFGLDPTQEITLATKVEYGDSYVDVGWALGPQPNTQITYPANDDFSEKDDHDDNLGAAEAARKLDGEMLQDVETVVACLMDFGGNSAEARKRLEQCNVRASQELVVEVFSRLRNDWGPAFTFFLWAGKQPGYAHSTREYNSMIAILGKMRRFDTAWTLVHEMKGGTPSRPGSSLVTPQTLQILIRRYCAIHDVGRAINTFYAFKKFGFAPGIDDFHGLLSALCRYKNVEDAEHLLLCNESAFPFETKSFNIVLNGWCNIMVYLREAKRFWRDMGNRGIPKDVVSYGSMISCYSKASNLTDVLKLYNQMREVGIEPDIKVYNAVVYALAKGKCMEDAKGLVKKMEEKGVAPNAVTFNSLIRPLCKARRVDDARQVFDEMLQRGLTPSIRTYHAFFDVARSVDEVFELLNGMKEKGCSPEIETYIMLIRKFCRWRQHESVYRLWNEMIENGLSLDRSAYIVLIHGLFLNGKLEEASRYYEEMKMKGFLPEPKTEEMIQAWLSGKEVAEQCMVMDLERKRVTRDPLDKKPRGASWRHVLKQPEAISVTRDWGFSSLVAENISFCRK